MNPNIEAITIPEAQHKLLFEKRGQISITYRTQFAEVG